jgi:sugar (pentulose or hexulose) kinase
MAAAAKRVAQFIGIDLSTTAFAVGVRSAKGDEDFVSIPMSGATKWNGQPAFNLEFVPPMFMEALEQLMRRGWTFGKNGALSLSVRQHDMVFLGNEDRPLMPALSWQCNAATQEVKELRKAGAQRAVGRIEERFILPKLIWAFRQDPSLREKLRHVMTTGDFIALMLTGRFSLSTSDALSNGLLDQSTKALAEKVMKKAGLDPAWFPMPIKSGTVVAVVQPPSLDDKASASWNGIKNILQGWQAVAGLGDNHAGGVGCGLKDISTIVISAGSSGTVIRKARSFWQLKGKAASFEYYYDRLLLMMLPDCAVWYDRFIKRFGEGKTLAQLDGLALQADLKKLVRVRQRKTESGWEEIYPKKWDKLGLAERVASTQASIALELLILTDKIISEVFDNKTPSITNFVLTGGLSQSAFFQQIFSGEVPFFVGSGRHKVLVSSHKGPLAHKSAALGAMINAMKGAGHYPDLASAIQDLCPLKPAARVFGERKDLLADFFLEHAPY